jgi:DNA-binding XRE family transcriptional regulator
MTDTTVIDRIQLARKDQSRAVFPTILNDVMVELGWTERQAADALDTSETTIQRWMAGRNIPTWSVCEGAYQHMICRIIEQDAIEEMTADWVEGNHRFGKNFLKFTLGFVAIWIVVWWVYALLT